MKEINLETAKQLLNVVDAGLTHGMGTPEPGRMCVEAAVCYALDLPHGDNPKCVDRAVRAFKIRLNDSPWSSPASRAQGLRALAVAQLGSKGVVDSRRFADLIIIGVIRDVMPIALESLSKRRPEIAETLTPIIAACRAASSLDDARAAARSARAATSQFYRSYYWDAAAADAADDAAAAAAAAADAAAAAAADAADAAAADAWRKTYDAERDRVLTLAAGIGLAALRECGSPGVALWDEIERERGAA